MASLFLHVLGVALVLLTIWAALETEGVPTDGCVSEGADADAGRVAPRATTSGALHVPPAATAAGMAAVPGGEI